MNKTTPLLFLLLHLLQVCTIKLNCPSLPVKNITCYNDYNRNITCMWNSTNIPDDANTTCTIQAWANRSPLRASCNLKPLDVSKPAQKYCSLIFSTKPQPYMFQTFTNLTMSLSCTPVKQSVVIYYQPVCHIKLDAPPKPDINNTTVSWLPQVTQHKMIEYFYKYEFQLQWKQQGQPWSDVPPINCTDKCRYELEEQQLIKGERYEVHVRVQPIVNSNLGAWSDWSPTASWVSTVGADPPGPAVDFIHIYIIAGVVAFALLRVFVIFMLTKPSGFTWWRGSQTWQIPSCRMKSLREPQPKAVQTLPETSPMHL